MDIRELYPEDYPHQLREIADPPERLSLRGSLPPQGHKTLAVVGSRALSSYGREACTRLIGGLAGYPISIVSGLALGADACGHTAALASGLHTLAIPGSGVSDAVLGPRTNLYLAHQILEAGGGLLSEHPPDHTARPYDFPSRNRIMAGLADAILIVEAGPKSGTLITMRLASEYDRELLCIPHRIGDPHGYGAHLFLRLGATCVTESGHIIEALRLPRLAPAERHMPHLEGREKAVYDLLTDPLPRDELVRLSGLPASEVLIALISLEIKGLAHEAFGTWRRI